MKRLLINAACLVLLMGTFSSCKKTLENDYQNPEKVQTGSVGKLFGGMYFNKRIHPSYWDMYTFVMGGIAPYTGYAAISPSATMWIPNSSYTEGRWVDFYEGSTEQDYNYNGPGIMSNYREMETVFNNLSEADKANYVVFMNAAKVILYDQAAQMVDLYGDIPFSLAGSLNSKGRTIDAAPFDDAATLYNTIITDLKALNTYFAGIKETAALTGAVRSEFKRQDLMYGGDAEKWQRYINSLRLRLLMRISNVDEGTAKTEITAMLSDAATFPTIDENSQNALFQESPNALKSDLYDVFRDFGKAPAYLLDTFMLANNDPRLDIFFDKNDDNGWKSFPWNGTAGEFQEVQTYATYDSSLFYYNYNLPGIIFTAAEVSFLKAEAAERWGVGAAQTSYDNGVKLSVAFWNSLQQNIILKDGTPGGLPVYTAPTDAEIATYLTTSNMAYTVAGTMTNLQKIYVQKWINFSVMQTGQAWAELRRTDYPKLNYNATGTRAGYEQPPMRIEYPASEKLYNAENYSKVEGKDKRDTKIFWDAQ